MSIEQDLGVDTAALSDPNPDQSTPAATPSGEPPVSTPAPAAPPAAQVRQDHAPITALLDEREKRRAAEARAAEAEKRWQEHEKRQREAAAEMPDPIVDPTAFRTWLDGQQKGWRSELEQTYDGRMAEQRVGLSAAIWSRHLGEEEWGKFNAWLERHPPEALAELEAQPDPYGAGYSYYQRHLEAERFNSVKTRLGDKDLDALIEEEVAKRMAAGNGGQPQPAAPEAQGSALNRDPKTGQFAPSQQQPKHRPESLATVSAAPTARSDSGESGYARLMAAKAAKQG